METISIAFNEIEAASLVEYLRSRKLKNTNQFVLTASFSSGIGQTLKIKDAKPGEAVNLTDYFSW